MKIRAIRNPLAVGLPAAVLLSLTCAQTAFAQQPAQPQPQQDPNAPPPIVIPGLPPIPVPQIPGVTPQAQPQPQPQPAQPYPPQPQPAQPYPTQPQPAQPYPQPAQPYPTQPQPTQPGWQQPYQPPQVQPLPPQQPQRYQPQVRASDRPRSASEMPFLYASGLGVGVGTGIALDGLFKIKDVGLQLVLPTLLGAAGALGVFLWDENATLHRGVPGATSLGTGLGFGLGMGINLAQFVLADTKDSEWSFGARGAVTWLTTVGGAVGGYFFGDFVRPNPKSLTFIASGTGWGTSAGLMLGAGLSGRNSSWDDTKKPLAWGGIFGYAIGTIGIGALDFAWTPSMQTQKYMWAGYGVGAGAFGLVGTVLYAASDSKGDVRPALALAALGGIAGATVMAVFTNDLQDDDDVKQQQEQQMGAPRTSKKKTWTPPFDLGFMPNKDGGSVTASGQW
jgi:hypothetical protein